MDLSIHLLTTEVPSDPTVRADGTSLAFCVMVADLGLDRWERRVRIAAPDGTTRRTTDGPSDRHPRYAPIGAALAMIRPDAAGVDQVWLFDGEAARPLTSFVESVISFTWSPDGTRLCARLRRRPSRPKGAPVVAEVAGYKRDGEGWEPSRTGLAIIEVASGSVTHLELASPGIGDATWTADGAALLVTVPHAAGAWRWDLCRAEIVSGRLDPVVTHGPWERAGSPLGLLDGTVLYVGGEAGPSHAVLKLVRTDGECVDVIPGFDRNVTVGVPAYPGVAPLLAADDILFTVNDRSFSRLHAVRLDGTSLRPLTADDVVVTGVAGGAGLIVVTETTSTSTGRLRVLGTEVVAPATFVDVPWVVEPFEAVAIDGAVIPCWLLRSKAAGSGPAPLLTDLHGGPHNVSNPTLGPGNLHRLLLSAAGWHILLPNVRGSDGYGDAWYRGLEAHGGWASADVDDVLCAVNAAVGRGVADPDRLSVTGYSYGGLLTAALTSRSGIFRAAAMGGALVDLRAFVTTSDLGPVLCEREVGGVPWGPSEYDLRSPIRQVGAVATPTLVFHGTADQRVPVAQAESWFQSLLANGVPTELVLFPDAPHGFVTAGAPTTVLDVGRRIAGWLTQWVR